MCTKQFSETSVVADTLGGGDVYFVQEGSNKKYKKIIEKHLYNGYTG